MANKLLDDIGLSHLWEKIIAKFATKTELQETVADTKDFIVTALNDLTFVVSDTVPTVDDRSIITFVVEE